jgi:hypothetical protein
MGNNSSESILRNLRSNNTLKNFELSYGWNSEALCTALQQFISSSTSIQRVGIGMLSFTVRTPFWQIAEALTNNGTATELRLWRCRFIDEGSAAALQNLFQSKQNLQSLKPLDCVFSERIDQIVESLVGALM